MAQPGILPAVLWDTVEEKKAALNSASQTSIPFRPCSKTSARHEIRQALNRLGREQPPGTAVTDSGPSGAQAHVLQPWDKRSIARSAIRL
jgi:hypothetical protein